MYVYYVGTSRPWRTNRDAWLDDLLAGRHNPKPPEWWLESQEREEGRNRTTASIIWARNYPPARKYLIWSQAPDDDFRRLGYLEG